MIMYLMCLDTTYDLTSYETPFYMILLAANIVVYKAVTKNIAKATTILFYSVAKV